MAPLVWLLPLVFILAGTTDQLPRPAPARFVIPETGITHGLTFAAPSNAVYCPQAASSGTILFLTPPTRCADSLTGPRIEIVSSVPIFERPPSISRCRRTAGNISLFGAPSNLCLDHAGNQRVYKVEAMHPADRETWLTLTLVTTRARATEDLKAFTALAASAEPCSTIARFVDEHGDRIVPDKQLGIGPRCPTATQLR